MAVPSARFALRYERANRYFTLFTRLSSGSITSATSIGRNDPPELLDAINNAVPARIDQGLPSVNFSFHIRRRRWTARDSTDFGNVSRRVPGIEARIAITDHLEMPGHSVEFREAAGSDQGRQAMLIAAKGLAMTAVDLLTNPEHLKRARAAFEEDVQSVTARR